MIYLSYKAFDNLIKACYSHKKYTVSFQPYKKQTEISIFLIEKLVVRTFLKIIGEIFYKALRLEIY